MQTMAKEKKGVRNKKETRVFTSTQKTNSQSSQNQYLTSQELIRQNEWQALTSQA